MQQCSCWGLLLLLFLRLLLRLLLLFLRLLVLFLRLLLLLLLLFLRLLLLLLWLLVFTVPHAGQSHKRASGGALSITCSA